MLIKGTVRGFQQRTENAQSALSAQGANSTITVWDFQVESPDSSGNLLLQPVEMRAASFQGFIQDGHSVEALGNWRLGTFQASKVHDLTTGAWIKGTGQSIGCVGILALGIFTALFWLFAIGGIGVATQVGGPSGFFALFVLLMALLPTIVLVGSVISYARNLV